MFVGLGAAFVAGCGASPEPVSAPRPAVTAPAVATGAPSATAVVTAAPEVAAPPKKVAKLRFDIDGEDSGIPLVDVVVGGQPTTLIVDTGATHHVIASWVAGQIGGTTTSAGNGMDHAGKSIALTQLEGVDIVVSGWGSAGANGTLVAPLPPGLQSQGIGGVLSPQALAKDGRAVVLDLRKGTMTEAAYDDAIRALAGEPGSSFTGDVRDCGTNGTLTFVRATIAGVAVEAQVDTGATHTTVSAGSEAGKKLKPLAKGKTTAFAASGMFTVPSVERARVQAGSLDAETTVDLVKRDARQACPNEAYLGTDLLRSCTLVLGPKELAAKCAPPMRMEEAAHHDDPAGR